MTTSKFTFGTETINFIKLNNIQIGRIESFEDGYRFKFEVNKEENKKNYDVNPTYQIPTMFFNQTFATLEAAKSFIKLNENFLFNLAIKLHRAHQIEIFSF